MKTNRLDFCYLMNPGKVYRCFTWNWDQYLLCCSAALDPEAAVREREGRRRSDTDVAFALRIVCVGIDGNDHVWRDSFLRDRWAGGGGDGTDAIATPLAIRHRQVLWLSGESMTAHTPVANNTHELEVDEILLGLHSSRCTQGNGILEVCDHRCGIHAGHGEPPGFGQPCSSPRARRHVDGEVKR